MKNLVITISENFKRATKTVFSGLFSYIGSINSSAKIEKGIKINLSTFIVYLAPYNLSGFNTCPKASDGCKIGCLFTSGRVIMDKLNIINKARINRTRAFFKNRNMFMNCLIKEIKNAQKLALKNGHNFAVRLNGTSDINFNFIKMNTEKGLLNIYEYFSDVNFYDYTKNIKRYNNKPENLHLTFSYSGENWKDCEKVMKTYNDNIAVVFDTKKNKPLPSYYKGFKVIDGDITDYRPADEKGCIIGLRFKLIKDKAKQKEALNSSFIVNTKSL